MTASSLNVNTLATPLGGDRVNLGGSVRGGTPRTGTRRRPRWAEGAGGPHCPLWHGPGPAQHIVGARNELEAFFNEALEYVRQQIALGQGALCRRVGPGSRARAGASCDARCV